MQSSSTGAHLPQLACSGNGMGRQAVVTKLYKKVITRNSIRIIFSLLSCMFDIFRDEICKLKRGTSDLKKAVSDPCCGQKTDWEGPRATHEGREQSLAGEGRPSQRSARQRKWGSDRDEHIDINMVWLSIRAI